MSDEEFVPFKQKRRLEYKAGKAFAGTKERIIRPEFRRNTTVVTEEDKKLWFIINHYRLELDRILGKQSLNMEVTDVEKRRIPFLRARIKSLKEKLFKSNPAMARRIEEAEIFALRKDSNKKSSIHRSTKANDTSGTSKYPPHR